MTDKQRCDNSHSTSADDVIKKRYRAKRGGGGGDCPPILSIRDAAAAEAEAHKWRESQKLGRDAGEAALQQWYEEHWPDFCRFRALEHAEGQQAWREFDPQRFGELYELVQSKDPLLNEILRKILFERWENLDVLVWAFKHDEQIVDRVVRILEILDVNSARLEPQIA
ncbi:hypothetical protein OAH18_03580 [bacterium]|nr:hypothetical protein [bacterium]